LFAQLICTTLTNNGTNKTSKIEIEMRMDIYLSRKDIEKFTKDIEKFTKVAL